MRFGGRLRGRVEADRGLSRLVYVDDSCEEPHSGIIVFGWVEVRPESWRHGLRAWLELRKSLFREFTIPPSTELHATDLVNGRRKFVTDPAALASQYRGSAGELLKKDVGRAAAIRCLETIRDCEHLRVGAAWMQTDERGPAFAREKYALYDRLVQHWDQVHAREGSFVMIAMDGDDKHFLDAHRSLALDSRHVIEDPAMHDSGHSQWIQMADLVAYVTLMSLNRHRGNEFAWDWYAKYLQTSDINGSPQEF